MSERKSILIVGGGGREHALTWRLRQSETAGPLLCAPGNPGIAALARCLPIGALEIDRLVEAVRREDVGLVVVGPEAPLHGGLADAVTTALGDRVAVFGCSARAAEIEVSKIFAKDFMKRHGIPTAAHTVARTVPEAARFLEEQARHGRGAWVVKADGLHAGKGVTVCDEPAAALQAAQEWLGRGVPVVIEERLLGREASVMALCDGEDLAVLPPCEDHKTLGEGDTGPMTGGMGAICPTLAMNAALLAQVRERVLLPAARGLAAEGRAFHGLLYAGLMITPTGPQALEFNCRFGDPETQALMLQWPQGLDLAAICEAVARRRLRTIAPPALEYAPGAAICVVMAAAGYPGTPRVGDPIEGIADAEAEGALVFQAGTARTPDKQLVTAGGRVLGVCARAADLAAARAIAYRAAGRIHFAGAALRHDIGARPDLP